MSPRAAPVSLPLAFEPNRGQADAAVDFVARAAASGRTATGTATATAYAARSAASNGRRA
jgi:hypothetical protein